MLVQEPGDALERGDVLVLPNAQIVRTYAGLWADGSGFGEHKARAADSSAAEVNKMPVTSMAIGRGVLAHGGDYDAIGKG